MSSLEEGEREERRLEARLPPVTTFIRPERRSAGSIREEEGEEEEEGTSVPIFSSNFLVSSRKLRCHMSGLVVRFQLMVFVVLCQTRT